MLMVRFGYSGLAACREVATDIARKRLKNMEIPTVRTLCRSLFIFSPFYLSDAEKT
jgi:hypothetical protein